MADGFPFAGGDVVILDPVLCELRVSLGRAHPILGQGLGIVAAEHVADSVKHRRVKVKPLLLHELIGLLHGSLTTLAPAVGQIHVGDPLLGHLPGQLLRLVVHSKFALDFEGVFVLRD